MVLVAHGFIANGLHVMKILKGLRYSIVMCQELWRLTLPGEVW
jgi:hypothetical protein